MGSETLGEALGRWRLLRGLSFRQLGKLTNYSHVYVWEIETGRKPSQPEFVAACDRALAAGGQLIAIAARTRTADGDGGDEGLGLEFPTDWLEGIRTVTTLWRHDAGRRRFLRDAAFVSSAFTVPVKRWLELVDGPAGTADALSEPPTAGTVREMTRTFRRLDNRYGGGQIRSAVVQYLDTDVAPMLRAGPPETLGRGFLSAVAEMTHLAGWLAYDACDHGIAQRYFIQALRLAMAAHDQALGAEILAGTSHQAIFLGRAKPAVELARAAHQTATRARVPALVAEASVMKAHAYARLNMERECTEALTEAETTFDQADRAEDPQWISYLDEAYLAAISGHCFLALGHREQAQRFARRSLDMHPGYVRGRLFNTLLLAGTHVLEREVEQTCAVGNEALDLASTVSSGRAVTYIDGLVRQLQPWRTDRRVKAFAERAKMVTAQG